MELIQESSSSVSTVCHSYHLTSFAVLVSAKHEPEQVTKQFTIYGALYLRTYLPLP